MTGLDAILRPRSIAVLGASRDSESMSGRLYRNVRAHFQGPVYPVNPHAGMIDGTRAHASIREVPEAVDLAIVAVPAARALEAARDALRHGARGLVVITAGFGEVGGAGSTNQEELLALARDSGARMVGPNCLGVLNTDPAIRLEATFSGFPFPAGNIGVATQSGALGFIIPDLLRASRVGLSSLVSMGNKADVNENDLLTFWRDDPRAEVCLLYLESFSDPREFVERARELTRSKPVVVLKAGRTATGTLAAGSHTAALASPKLAADATLRQAGVIHVDDLAELVDVGAILATQPLPAGRRVAILTNAGGPGVLIADSLEEQGLSVPALSDELQHQLRRHIRSEATSRNPVDLIGSNDPDLYTRCLRLLLESDEADTVVAMFVPIRPGDSERMAVACRELRRELPSRGPLLAVFVESCPPAEHLAGEGVTIPAFSSPERAARALGKVVAHAEARRQLPGRIPALNGVDDLAIRGIVERSHARNWVGGWIPPDEIQRLLVASGLKVPRWGLAASEREAAALAEEFGGPLVLKVDAPGVVHKRAAGGLAVGVRGARDVGAAFRRILAAVPDARGVFAQELVAEGVDALVGLTRDPIFGPMVGCGLGGTWTEALGRVDFRLAPLTDRDANELVRENPIGRLLLSSAGGRAPGTDALRDVLSSVSHLACLAPEIGEADLNPVRILTDGTAVVLDARVRITTERGGRT